MRELPSVGLAEGCRWGALSSMEARVEPVLRGDSLRGCRGTGQEPGRQGWVLRWVEARISGKVEPTEWLGCGV